MEHLAGIMGIEVLGYSVMSNHFHCVLRSRHDVVATWSDDEVALKWWMLCPARKDKDGSPAEPTGFELKRIKGSESKGWRRTKNRQQLSVGNRHPNFGRDLTEKMNELHIDNVFVYAPDAKD